MAARFRKEANQASPPILLKEVLRARTVHAKFVPDLDVEGRLVCDDDGFELLLNERLRHLTTRARFTTAHELGHTLFYRRDSRKLQRVLPRSFNNAFEERLCNCFASELLIPFEYLSRVAEGFQQKSEKEKAAILHDVAATCLVAREAAACHLVRTLRWWNSILLFTAEAGKKGPRDRTGRARRIVWAWYPPNLDGKLFIPGNAQQGYPKIKIPELQSAAMSARDQPHCIEIRSGSLQIGNLSALLDRVVGEKTQIWVIDCSPSTGSLNLEESWDLSSSHDVLMTIPLPEIAA